MILYISYINIKNMKKILLLILLIPLVSYSQHSDRVLQIKKMYKETKSYEKDNQSNCISKEWTTNNQEMDNGLKRKVVRCTYPDQYSRIILDFDITFCGGAPSVYAEYYYKYGNLYFAYIKHRPGTSEEKIRLYFKSDGSIEKVLVDYGNEEGNIDMTNSTDIDKIIQPELDRLKVAQNKLN